MKMYRLFLPGSITILLLCLAIPNFAAEGLITKPSAHSVEATINKFEAAVKARGLTLFTRLDHSAAAKSVGLTMPPATVIVFGNPRLGTPNFLKTPTLAIDLPLKALVWEDEKGQVFLSYNSATYLYGTIYPRHGMPSNQTAMAKFEHALNAIADEAVK